MRSRWFVATALTLAVAGNTHAQMQVLWDQSVIDLSSAAILPDAAAGCAPGLDTVHQASDFHLQTPATVTRVTTYYTATDADVFGATAEAWLWVTPKHGSRPAPLSDDPRRDGRLVPVTTRRIGDHHRLVADDLGMVLLSGEYWISLTPVVPVGVLGPEHHLCSTERRGDPSVAFRGCDAAGRGWTANGNGLDAALLIEGILNTTAGGRPDWPWRLPR